MAQLTVKDMRRLIYFLDNEAVPSQCPAPHDIDRLQMENDQLRQMLAATRQQLALLQNQVKFLNKNSTPTRKRTMLCI